MMKNFILFNISFFILISFIPIFPKEFKGAELRTKATYTYGRFEVRMKSAQREGMLSSFFTYHEISNTSEWNEIDIEILGRYNDDVQFNTITPGQTNHVRHQFVNFNPHLDFHTYAIEWTPEYVSWFIDDVEVYKQTETHIQTLNKPQKIMMNIWIPQYENWAGKWNSTSLPAFAYYDFVKYYSYSPGIGNYGSNNNFTFQWTDDFDFWNQTRWEKATHTFDGNLVDFIPENCVFKDGYMILCLTDNFNLGLQDKIEPSINFARYNDNNILINFSEELDKTSAENISNYFINQVVINSATLLSDLKSIILNVSNFDTALNYNLIVKNIKDDSIPQQNTMSLKAFTIIKSRSLSFPLKINIGGEEKGDYLSDQEFNPFNEYGYFDGNISEYSSINISNTDEDTIYLSERWGIVKYFCRIPNGKYKVKLMFAENYHSSINKRIFDIFIEDKYYKNNIDIFKEVGKNTAYNIEFTDIFINDELLEISFAAQIDQPILNGLIIESLPTKIDDIDKSNINDFFIFPNYPNPFNGLTTINFTIPINTEVIFQVFNVLGQVVYTKNLGYLTKGINSFIYNAINNSGESLSSGIYIYSIIADKSRQFKKFIIIN